jgi:autonomous glycyl radical cofactor GrcA
MKTFYAALLLCVCAAGAAAQDAHHHGLHRQQAEAATSASDRVLRGDRIGADTRRVSFADALKEPQKYADKAVVIEGVVRRVCQAEGCWVEIGPQAEGDGSVRVTFDHKFAVPKDAARMKFRAEGTLKVKTLSRETVEHLVKEDGAKIKTNADGTADEVTFLATGVELWK